MASASNLIRFREKKLLEVESSVQNEYQKKEKTRTLMKTVLKKDYFLESTEIEQPQQISEAEVINSNLLQQLVELYRYFCNNKEVIGMMRRDVSNYRLVDQEPICLINNRNGRGKKAETIFMKDSPKEFAIDNFPILKEYLAKREK